MFYIQSGRLKTVNNKTITFKELQSLADPDGVLRCFSAYRCVITDCPTIRRQDFLYGLAAEEVCLEDCDFLDSDGGKRVDIQVGVLSRIEDVDRQIDMLLEKRKQLQDAKK